MTRTVHIHDTTIEKKHTNTKTTTTTTGIFIVQSLKSPSIDSIINHLQS